MRLERVWPGALPQPPHATVAEKSPPAGWGGSVAAQRAYSPPFGTFICVTSTRAWTGVCASSGPLPSPWSVTVTVVLGVAPMTTPYSTAERGPRCSTARSLNTPEKKAPFVALGKGGSCSGWASARRSSASSVRGRTEALIMPRWRPPQTLPLGTYEYSGGSPA